MSKSRKTGLLRSLVAATTLALALAGCGGGGGGGGGGSGTGGAGGAGGGGGGTTTSTLWSLTITPPNPMINVVGTQQFTATARYYTCTTSGGTTTCSISGPTDVTSSVAWASGTSTVATISSTGLATAKSVGTTTITATSGAYIASTTLSVTNWTTRLSGPRGFSSVNGLAFNGSNYVSVESSLSSSTDLLIWNEQSNSITGLDVLWNGTQYVDSGFTGMNYSTDGLNWTNGFFNSTGKSPYHLAYSSTLPLWVVAAGSEVATSTDGATWNWTALPLSGLPLGADVRAVTWTGTQFVAVGMMGTILTSPDGVTWTPQTSGTTQAFSAVGSTSTLIVACTVGGSAGSGIYTSTNGVIWTYSSTTPTDCNSIINAGGQWVAGGNTGIATSTNGTTWTTATTQPHGWIYSLVYNGTQYVAGGQTIWSKPAVYTSTNGAAWTMKSLYDRFLSVARNPTTGLLVAVTGTDRSLVSSDNGVTWQYGGVTIASTADYLMNVVWSPGLSQFVASGSGTAWGSTDGLNWTVLGTGACSGKMAASTTLLVSSCYYGVVGTSGVMSSTNGVTWTASTTYPSTQLVNNVFWTGTQWLALGTAGDISTSFDAMTWTLQTSGSTNALNGFATDGTTMVVVGGFGTILTSTNGTAWTKQTSNTTYALNSVTWTGAQFVAVGAAGTVLTSTNGTNWAIQTTPYTVNLVGSDPFNLNDVVQAGTSLVVVGDRGLVATSP